MNDQVVGYAACAVFSALYVVMDLAQERISLKVLLWNFYFLLYWLLQLIVSSLAFFVLHSYDPMKNWPPALVALAAVFGSSIILQNQLVKIAGRPIVDFSAFQKGLRLQVLAQAVKDMAGEEKKRITRITDMLALKFKDKAGDLEIIFARVMLFGGVADTQVEAEIQRIKNRSVLLGLPIENELARMIVQTDIEYAMNILYHPV